MAINAEGYGIVFFFCKEAADEYCEQFNNEILLRGVLKKKLPPFTLQQKGLVGFITYSGEFHFPEIDRFIKSLTPYVKEGIITLVDDHNSVYKFTMDSSLGCDSDNIPDDAEEIDEEDLEDVIQGFYEGDDDF